MAVKLGLVGCGRISKNHFEALTQIREVELVACCDIVAERAEQAAQKYGIPHWTTDYLQMVKRADIDLISICTPSGLHPQHGIMAARHGKDVLTEKPMGVCLQDADQLIKVCDQCGVRLFTVLQNRLNPSIQMLHQAVEEGRFGRIFFIQANVFWTRPQEYYDMAPWRGTWEYDGGAFMNQASHYVDMVRWLGGPVESVTAITGTLERDIEAEDTGSAVIKFRSGALGSINVTTLTYPKNLEGSITLLGEKGTARVSGIAMNEITEWRFADQRDYDQHIQDSATNPDSVYGFGHSGYYRSVIDTITSGVRPLVDGREGRKSLELLEAIYQASRRRRVIGLPL